MSIRTVRLERRGQNSARTQHALTRRMPRLVPLVQGTFYLATGLWPVLAERSFEAVTGPKVDKWLVRTMGGVLAAVGASLVAAAFESKRQRSTTLVGAGVAAALGISDVLYAQQGRISRVYFADAAAEAAILVGYAAAHLMNNRVDPQGEP